MNYYDEEKCMPIELQSKVFPKLAAKLEKGIQRGEPDACWPCTGFQDRHGYRRVSLPRSEFGALACGGGRRVAVSRALMILRAGRGLDHKAELALHSCNNRWCCNPAHIRIGTHGENMRDMVADGTANAGTRHGHAKLSEAQVRQAHELYPTGWTQRQLGDKYGVSQAAMNALLTGKYWKHLHPSNQ